MSVARTSMALGDFEPSLTTQLLRGCGSCGMPHPIALRSPDPTICPGCGAPAAPPGTPVTERAVLAGWTPWVLIARFCFWAGRKLAELARSI